MTWSETLAAIARRRAFWDQREQMRQEAEVAAPLPTFCAVNIARGSYEVVVASVPPTMGDAAVEIGGSVYLSRADGLRFARWLDEILA